MLKPIIRGVVAGALMLSLIPQAFAQRKIITIDGSSTVFPVTEAVAEEFQKVNRDVKVTVGISGTGGGFKKFCRGETDISDASRPIKGSEMDACLQAGIQYIELPIAFDALSVVINPANTWAETMTVAELKKIWEPSAQGVIKKWNQVNPRWADLEFKLYAPGADSGTFEYFTEAITGKAMSSRGDFTASEDDNVLVQGVSADKAGLGYFGMAYYTENADRLKAVKIDNGQGGVMPTVANVENGSYAPLSRPIFIYVSRKAMRKPEVSEFVRFYLKNVSGLVGDVGYVALPQRAYDLGLARFDKVQTGTAFGGKAEIGSTIESILTRGLSK